MTDQPVGPTVVVVEMPKVAGSHVHNGVVVSERVRDGLAGPYGITAVETLEELLALQRLVRARAIVLDMRGVNFDFEAFVDALEDGDMIGEGTAIIALCREPEHCHELQQYWTVLERITPYSLGELDDLIRHVRRAVDGVPDTVIFDCDLDCSGLPNLVAIINGGRRSKVFDSFEGVLDHLATYGAERVILNTADVAASAADQLCAGQYTMAEVVGFEGTIRNSEGGEDTEVSFVTGDGYPAINVKVNCCTRIVDIAVLRALAAGKEATTPFIPEQADADPFGPLPGSDVTVPPDGEDGLDFLDFVEPAKD